jgi:hypothetical protein
MDFIETAVTRREDLAKASQTIKRMQALSDLIASSQTEEKIQG